MQQIQVFSRFYYLDNLRAIAMIGGVFFHAALAYSPMAQGFWPSADPAQHVLFDLFAWASHLCRMPLFFLLAGFFCALLWHKAGGAAFLKNRLLRIALPLLLFLPILYAITGLVLQYGLQHVHYQSPFLSFIRQIMAQPEQTPMPLSTMHLWFLYHLLFLYLLTWSARILCNVQPGSWLLARKPNSLLLLFIVTCLPALYAVPVPFPAPEWIFPALWALWFYGLFFGLGYGFFKYPELLQRFASDRRTYLLIGTVSYGFYTLLLPENLVPERQPQHLLKLLICAFEAITAVLWTLSAVLYAREYLNRNNSLLSYLSHTSYWVYLVHLPVLFFIQFLITDLSWALGIKFMLSIFGTLAICLLSFHLLVSRTWLAKILTNHQATSAVSAGLNKNHS